MKVNGVSAQYIDSIVEYIVFYITVAMSTIDLTPHKPI